ncbi:hypothetical protein PspLS_11393 [Pyricularia sp. CBS 133598]|nr:hypothetical protein PspLS_11393 [Pyricularia sp. CBS 133598]
MIRGYPLIFPAVIFWLMGVALAVPAIVYRGDGRDPATLKSQGGFVSYGASTGSQTCVTLEQHVLHKPEGSSPYVSTSDNKESAFGYATSTADGYLYAIDTDGIQFTDVEADFARRKQKNKFSWECEWATTSTIPWTSIIGWKKALLKGAVMEPNPDYAGCKTASLKKRGLGGACALPSAGKTGGLAAALRSLPLSSVHESNSVPPPRGGLAMLVFGSLPPSSDPGSNSVLPLGKGPRLDKGLRLDSKELLVVCDLRVNVGQERERSAEGGLFM